ncbi:hypothetical protein [Escherichia coli]|uniref:hypothetical protein n=1 Tax=Escherichia coli TaxID=562 RepID=UPI002035E9C3|nr:hypothetical protein [Escherichia coli]
MAPLIIDTIRYHVLEKNQRAQSKLWICPFAFTNSVGVNGDIKIANILFNNNEIKRDNWLTNSEWYNKGNNFFILENKEQLNIVKKIYGQPEDIESVCDVIFVKYRNHIYVK